MDQDFIIERKIIKIGSHMLNTRSEDLKKFNLTSNQSESLLFFAQNEHSLLLYCYSAGTISVDSQ